MKKILEVTFEPPSEKSGGGLGITQSILSLVSSHKVDYLGPSFDNYIKADKNLQILGLMKLARTGRLQAFINGSFTRYYSDWKKLSNNLDWSQYEALHLEFTRWPFVVETAKRHGVPVMIRVHNVEADYFYNLWSKERKFSDYIRYWHFKQAEKKCVKYADKLVCLTEKDKERLIELYGKSIVDKIDINPVCIEDKEIGNTSREKYFLITGSLWYGPNADGVIWFLQNIWNDISSKDFFKDFKLYIAGAHPCEEIKKLYQRDDNIQLIDTPEDMTMYFKNAYCYIAPIFSGAGMKVKVAEAMMYGLPIIATSHALIGYEKATMLQPFDSTDQIKNEMIRITSLNDSDYNNERKNVYDAFKKFYSMENSIKFYDSIIDGRM